MKNMLIIAMLMTAGCKKDVPVPQSACTAANPLDVQWVKNLTGSIINCTCQVTLFQGTYAGQTVYFTLINDPSCDVVFSAKLLDCYGNTIKTYDSSLLEQQAFYSEVKIDKSLYICKR